MERIRDFHNYALYKSTFTITFISETIQERAVVTTEHK